MPLNIVQQDFVNDAARPQMETIIRIIHELDTFVVDYDALQSTADALPTDTTVLDDAGSTPRDDAPILTGKNVSDLRDFSNNMSAVITANAKNVLISLMVRNLSTVLKLG